MSTRREITRAATVDEIKRTAYALMRSTGSPDVRFADIARAMSMTAPALYRYFSSRDALLNALMADAFNDLGDVLEQALDCCPPDDPYDRLSAVCHAFRRWATADPVRFSLVFGLPAPGFVRAEDPEFCERMDRAFGYLCTPVAEAAARGAISRPGGPAMGGALCAQLQSGDAPAHGVPLEHKQPLLHGWASLHGFVSLEVFGHFPFLEAAALDELFEGLVRSVALYVGIPAPAEPRPAPAPAA